MPEMDGVGFLRELRADTLLAPIPCIVLSSLGDRVTEAAPVAAWLTKPVRRVQLRGVLTSVLGRTAPAAEHRPAVVDQSALYRGARVLLVEDNPEVQDTAGMLLDQLGYRVFRAQSAVAALQLLQSGEAVDLVFSDIIMPGELDGVALAKRIKKNPKLQSVPIILLTAKDRPLNVVEGINAGARHYITKPFKMQDVLEKVALAARLKK